MRRIVSLVVRVARDQRVSFLLVGGFNTALGFAVFVVADLFVGRPVDVAFGETVGSLTTLAIAHVIGVIVAYLLYRRFVFRVRGHFWRDLARFESVYLVQLAFNAVALPLLVALGAPRIPAQFGILFIAAIGSYLGHKFFSFRRPTLVVRRAQTDDAAAIAAVHVQSWRETYAHLLPAPALAALDVSARAERWTDIIAGGTAVWVAVDGARVVGWASVSTGHGQPRDVELEGIYVLASHHGKDIGPQLLTAALGESAAYLWVAVDNPRALAFYRRNGFEPDGATKVEQLLDSPVPVQRLVR